MFKPILKRSSATAASMAHKWDNASSPTERKNQSPARQTPLIPAELLQSFGAPTEELKMTLTFPLVVDKSPSLTYPDEIASFLVKNPAEIETRSIGFACGIFWAFCGRQLYLWRQGKEPFSWEFENTITACSGGRIEQIGAINPETIDIIVVACFQDIHVFRVDSNIGKLQAKILEIRTNIQTITTLVLHQQEIIIAGNKSAIQVFSFRSGSIVTSKGVSKWLGSKDQNFTVEQLLPIQDSIYVLFSVKRQVTLLEKLKSLLFGRHSLQIEPSQQIQVYSREINQDGKIVLSGSVKLQDLAAKITANFSHCNGHFIRDPFRVVSLFKSRKNLGITTRCGYHIQISSIKLNEVQFAGEPIVLPDKFQAGLFRASFTNLFSPERRSIEVRVISSLGKNQLTLTNKYVCVCQDSMIYQNTTVETPVLTQLATDKKNSRYFVLYENRYQVVYPVPLHHLLLCATYFYLSITPNNSLQEAQLRQNYVDLVDECCSVVGARLFNAGVLRAILLLNPQNLPFSFKMDSRLCGQLSAKLCQSKSAQINHPKCQSVYIDSNTSSKNRILDCLWFLLLDSQNKVIVFPNLKRNFPALWLSIQSQVTAVMNTLLGLRPYQIATNEKKVKQNMDKLQQLSKLCKQHRQRAHSHSKLFTGVIRVIGLEDSSFRRENESTDNSITLQTENSFYESAATENLSDLFNRVEEAQQNVQHLVEACRLSNYSGVSARLSTLRQIITDRKALLAFRSILVKVPESSYDSLERVVLNLPGLELHNQISFLKWKRTQLKSPMIDPSLINMEALSRILCYQSLMDVKGLLGKYPEYYTFLLGLVMSSQQERQATTKDPIRLQQTKDQSVKIQTEAHSFIDGFVMRALRDKAHDYQLRLGQLYRMAQLANRSQNPIIKQVLKATLTKYYFMNVVDTIQN